MIYQWPLDSRMSIIYMASRLPPGCKHWIFKAIPKVCFSARISMQLKRSYNADPKSVLLNLDLTVPEHSQPNSWTNSIQATVSQSDDGLYSRWMAQLGAAFSKHIGTAMVNKSPIQGYRQSWWPQLNEELKHCAAKPRTCDMVNLDRCRTYNPWSPLLILYVSFANAAMSIGGRH